VEKSGRKKYDREEWNSFLRTERDHRVLHMPTIEWNFYMVVGNIGGSLCNLFHVALLAPGVLRWFLGIWKVSAPLCS
jgi:hypothetical protein